MDIMDLIKRLDLLYIKRRIILQKEAQDTGLYLGQLPILEYIINHNNCSQVDISRALHLSPASVAISTKRLQKAGMIEKIIDKENLKYKKLSITDKGNEKTELCRKLFHSLDKKMFKGFDKAELIQLKEYLDRLISNISDGENNKDINFCEIVAMENDLKNSESGK